MGVMDNLGFIKQAAAFPCIQPDPILIIEAAAHAGVITLMSAVTFGCNDIVKMRAGIAPWHRRGMIALINGAIPAEQSGLAKNLLKFTIPVEKALFFFFVVDLTVGFIAHWQSMVFKLGACLGDVDDAQASGSDPSWHSFFPPAFQTIPYNNMQRHGNPARIQSIGFTVPPGYFYTASFELKPVASIVGQTVGSCETRLRQVATQPFSMAPRKSEPPWFGNQFVASDLRRGQNKQGHYQEFIWEAKTDVLSHAEGGSMACSVTSRPELQDNIIPVNCFGKNAPGAEPHF